MILNGVTNIDLNSQKQNRCRTFAYLCVRAVAVAVTSLRRSL